MIQPTVIQSLNKEIVSTATQTATTNVKQNAYSEFKLSVLTLKRHDYVHLLLTFLVSPET